MNSLKFALVALLAAVVLLVLAAQVHAATRPKPFNLGTYLGKPSSTTVFKKGKYVWGCETWNMRNGLVQECIILGRAKAKSAPTPKSANKA